ncbi:alpha/beta hydrolase [Paracoccus sp. ME4]|uniref:alpha/beta hydrolase n=1 Tax=Paracoccus sp. ME4 TaxID=3138066 RepID=UPI00398AA483
MITHQSGRVRSARARGLRACVAVMVVAVLAACAARPTNEVLRPVAATVEGARVTQVYVATTRAPRAAGSAVFGAAPSLGTSHAAFRVSVPPGHRPGRIEWPDGPADPATSFATLEGRVLPEDAFRRAVSADPRRPAGVVVFVHGFNHSFPEALYRLVQLSVDSRTEGVPVLFSWPSAGSPFAYLADKDAVAFSRDALARTLQALVEDADGAPVQVIAHSMGGLLTMETLRQLRLDGRDDVLDQLSVTMAAPDIDPDLFRAQIAVIGPMARTMTLLVSRDDRALDLSSRLSSHRPRVGALDVADPRLARTARAANIAIVDISALPASNRVNHDRYVELSAIYGELHAETLPYGPRAARLGEAGVYVLDAILGN